MKIVWLTIILMFNKKYGITYNNSMFSEKKIVWLTIILIFNEKIIIISTSRRCEWLCWNCDRYSLFSLHWRSVIAYYCCKTITRLRRSMN